MPVSKFLLHSNENKNLNFKLTQANILRYRQNANPPCNKEIEDYDFYMQGVITNETGCTFPFWKKYLKAPLNPEECKSAKELKSVIDKIQEYDAKSCVELFNSVAWNWVDKKGKEGSTHVKFQYIDDYYQEIEYLTSFGIESLISNLGGFTGIFLGYSLMQFPELLGRYKL